MRRFSSVLARPNGRRIGADKLNTQLFKIASAYIRVSDERQDEYSPDSQLKKIREYAAKEGYQIPDEYVFYDDGISGKSARKRGDFNRMIAIAKEKDHPFDVIYVWKFSRFARNQEESMVYKNLLRKKGVSVVSVSEPIPEGHFGTLIERIIEWMDEFYLINLGTEVIRGMTEKISRGEPTCNAPFGYVMKDKKYYPDEATAPIVNEIFTRFANGEGAREIAVSLGARGIRTKFGNMPENRWIEYILRNPCYIGKLRWSQDGERAVSKRHYDNEKILTVDANHEAIISQELWDKVQARIDQQKKSYSAHARKEQPIEYMLKGLVRCSACGATLACTGKSKRSKYRSLQCCNYTRGTCLISHSITLPKIEQAFIEALEQAIGTQKFTISPKKQRQTEKPTINYNQLITLEERKLQRAKEAYLAEIDSLEQYKQNKAQIEAQISELITMRDSTPSPQIATSEFVKKVVSIVDFIKRDDVSPKAKNEALHTIIEKIVFDKPNSHLAIYFHE